MRILYITMDNPAVETILGGMHDETLSGLPAFYYPFKMLLGARLHDRSAALFVRAENGRGERTFPARESDPDPAAASRCARHIGAAAASGARDAPMSARAAL